MNLPHSREIDGVFSDGFRMPENFAWGVGNSAYQTEGGLNGNGQPQNNWARWERTGKATPTGEATRFLKEYPLDIENSRKMSLNHFRMGLEWARIQPHVQDESAEIPPFDKHAIEHYAKLIATIRENKMEPVATLHHFTHPMWAGEDMWLESDNLELFKSYVHHTVTSLNEILTNKYKEKPILFWESTNEPNIVPAATYLFGRFPHRRGISLKNFLEATKNQLLAHAIAYESIHEIYRNKGWQKPMVSLATVSMCIYWLDMLIFDILLARKLGIERNDLPGWLKTRASEFHAEMEKIQRPYGLKFKAGKQIEKLLENISAKILNERKLETLIEKIYYSPFEGLADYIAIDFYDPFLGHYLKFPALEDIKKLNFDFGIKHWEWVQNPHAFYRFLKIYSSMHPDFPVHVFENGICNRVKDGRAIPRKDGWDRPAYLKAFLFELARAKKEGAKVEGYFHWSITDNYEWGSYEPRFGLHGIDYENGARRSSLDSAGANSPTTYRRIIEGVTSGSIEEIRKAFT